MEEHVYAAEPALAREDEAAHEVRQLAWMGGVSLICWTGAITAGRMIGYW